MQSTFNKKITLQSTASLAYLQQSMQAGCVLRTACLACSHVPEMHRQIPTVYQLHRWQISSSQVSTAMASLAAVRCAARGCAVLVTCIAALPNIAGSNDNSSSTASYSCEQPLECTTLAMVKTIRGCAHTAMAMIAYLSSFGPPLLNLLLRGSTHALAAGISNIVPPWCFFCFA